MALERDDGSPRWRHELGDDQILVSSAVVDGVAFLVTFDRIVAVADGDEQWRWPFDEGDADSQTEIAGVTSDHLLVAARNDRHEYRLAAFDIVTGDRDWVLAPITHPNVEFGPQTAVHDGTVYLGTDRLRAFDAATGTENWGVTADAGPIQSLTVAESSPGGHAVFVHAGGNHLAAFTPNGDRAWQGSVDGSIKNYIVDDSVYVATDEALYALERPPDF